jgi:hypothetical protein
MSPRKTANAKLRTAFSMLLYKRFIARLGHPGGPVKRGGSLSEGDREREKWLRGRDLNP